MMAEHTLTYNGDDTWTLACSNPDGCSDVLVEAEGCQCMERGCDCERGEHWGCGGDFPYLPGTPLCMTKVFEGCGYVDWCFHIGATNLFDLWYEEKPPVGTSYKVKFEWDNYDEYPTGIIIEEEKK